MRELCNSTAVIHHCSRVPGKGLLSFATVMDGAGGNTPYLISDAQES